MTLSFWYLLQEAILDAEFTEDSDAKWKTLKLVFAEAVATLVRKARWPTMAEGFGGWHKGEYSLRFDGLAFSL